MTQYISVAQIRSDMFFIMLHHASKFGWLTNNGHVSIHNVHTILINQQCNHACVSMYEHFAVNNIKR